MKKNVWIFNHYATNMFFDKAGRHYWFAENLLKNGYKPTIFCASTNHFSEKNINTNKKNYITKTVNNIPFVFVDSPNYLNNGKKRILNMIVFSKRLLTVAKEYAKLNSKPDIILASSVHPLTLVTGIRIAKKLGIPCVCEIRDLWPESLVAYGILEKNNRFTKLLYQGEKAIYKKADSIIMTWQGGRQYIQDQGWDNQINLNKVHHISNGVIINSFDKNAKENEIVDSDLDDTEYKNIVYAGSIRKVNNLGLLIDAAKIIQNKNNKIRFIIYGSGDEKKKLKEKCEKENINNVIFKERVEKSQVPSILKKSYANILHNSSTSLNKYGQSQNKFFEYLAAGKCIIQTYTTGYSVLEKYNCGVSAYEQRPEVIAELILKLCNDDNLVKLMGKNAREISYKYDFKKLTNKLINVIEKV